MKELDKTTQEDLTAEEIKYSHLLAKGYPKNKAYREAFPLQAKQSYDHIRRKAIALAEKPEIVTEVATTKQRQARLARLAEDRLEEILTEVKPGKVVGDVAMFLYEQANGKAVQKTEVKGQHVVVTYDLSGGKGGEVPQEVLDQLKD